MLADVFALFLANLVSQGGGASSALLTGGGPALVSCGADLLVQWGPFWAKRGLLLVITSDPGSLGCKESGPAADGAQRNSTEGFPGVPMDVLNESF